MKGFFRATVASAAAIIAASAVMASDAQSSLEPFGPFSHWYQDSAGLQPGGNGSDTLWRDVIGEDVFDTKGIAAKWADGKLHLALVTNFPDANVVSAGRPVSPADLALDLDGDGVLETGIVLSSIWTTGDRGVTHTPNIRRAAAYRVTKWLHPSDILKTTYGQGWRWSGPGGAPMQQSAIPVWVAEGDERHDLDVTVDWRRLPGAGTGAGRYAILVTLTHHDNPKQLWNVPIVWGTAVCGNDVMFANTSRLGEPGAPPIMTSDGRDAPTQGPRWNNGPGTGFPSIGASAPVVLTSGKNNGNTGLGTDAWGGSAGAGGSGSGGGSGNTGGSSGDTGSGAGGDGGTAIDDLFDTGGGNGAGRGSDGGGSDDYGTGGSAGGGTSDSGDSGGASGGTGGSTGIDTVTPVPVPPLRPDDGVCVWRTGLPRPAADPVAADAGLKLHVALEQALGDGAGQYFVGAVGNVGLTDPRISLMQAQFVGEAHGTMGLDRLVDGAGGGLHRIGLGHGKLLDRPLAPVEQLGDVDAHQVRRVDLGRGLREGEANALILADGAAEGLALLGIVDGHLQGPAGKANRAGGVINTSHGDAEQADLESLVQLAHQLPGRDLNLIEMGDALIAADMALHANNALDLDPRRGGRHQEGADAALLLRRQVRVGLGEDDAIVGNRNVRRPDLGAADLLAIAIGHGAGFQHGRVRARARLRHAGHHGPACHHVRHDALARFRRDSGEHRAGTEGPVRNDEIAKPVVRPAEPVDMLHQHIIGDHAHPGPAEFLRHRDVEEAPFGRSHAHGADVVYNGIFEAAVKPVRVARIVEQVMVLLVPGDDFLLTEGSNGIGDLGELFGQVGGEGGHGAVPGNGISIVAREGRRGGRF